MKNYNVPAAQSIYMQMLSQYNYPLNDSQQALLFAKALQYQNGVDPSAMVFASDNEFFVLPGVMVGAQRKVAKKMIKFGSPR